MGMLIENRPVACSFCGFSPVYGQESSTTQGDKIIHECSWVCPRCAQLVRRDSAEEQVEKK